MPTNHRFLFFFALSGLAGASLAAGGGWRTPATEEQGDGAQDSIGYDDTPMLPGGEWHVHDGKRPQPPSVTPGEGGGAPSDATVLFGGSDLGAWRSGDGEARWTLEEGAMVVNGTGPIRTREVFGDLQLHLEFSTPAEVQGHSQGRGNSGVFLMERYEVQILDSYHNPSYPDGQAGAMYGQYPPQVNASSPPGEWQTYDLFFQAPRFEGEELIRPARLTLLHNGVLVQHAREFIGATTHKQVARYSPHAEKAPIQLQDHGNPVRYRNIWVRPIAE